MMRADLALFDGRGGVDELIVFLRSMGGRAGADKTRRPRRNNYSWEGTGLRGRCPRGRRLVSRFGRVRGGIGLGSSRSSLGRGAGPGGKGERGPESGRGRVTAELLYDAQVASLPSPGSPRNHAGYGIPQAMRTGYLRKSVSSTPEGGKETQRTVAGT